MKASLITPLICLLSATPVSASIIIEGDYLRTAVSQNGTLGYGGKASPGIQYDTTGQRQFGDKDYLLPGRPWEVFSIYSTQSSLLVNSNEGPTDLAGTLNDVSIGSPYDMAVDWQGQNAFFSLSTLTFLDDDSEQINFITTITAKTPLTELQFLRAIDPDPDASTINSHRTMNQRGDNQYSANDWVVSSGKDSKLSLGLYSSDDLFHNTGVTFPWSVNPEDYLKGSQSEEGDSVIGLAFDIGTLNTNESVSFTYSYRLESDRPVAPPSTNVPLPATAGLFLIGLVSFARRWSQRNS
ncbi:hypothetical protein [Neptunomonas marina]|uniref:PEP-CTERM sorting domain-containing protein n=1 Tax=Neptunomonas marina TaxID=1815562 RepID=A0A437Q988_9GAMM|nr:hypothetical protein [Neptunomonas marina]RVU31075.1 hypothetical protein EOE65_08695 [Neptunomonas marina]